MAIKPLNLRLFPFIFSRVMSTAIDHNKKEHVELQKLWIWPLMAILTF